MASIRKRIYTKQARVEIVNAISIRMIEHTMNPTPSDYNKICVKLITAYPGSADVTGTGYVRLKKCVPCGI